MNNTLVLNEPAYQMKKKTKNPVLGSLPKETKTKSI